MRAGSCLVAMVMIDDDCYVVNLGDSWALLSADKGNKVFMLTKDHKPSDFDEIKRIEKAGGDVYVSTIK